MAEDRGTSYEGKPPAGTPPPPAPSGGRRVALVIGNGQYRHAKTLPNPPRDADAIAETFSSLGFDAVRKLTDLELKPLSRAFTEFRLEAADADTAVIYFAGHGIEIDGINHLIPVDAELDHVVHVPAETVPLASVLHAARGARRLRVVILDACRNNPFLERMRGLELGRDAGGWSRVALEQEPSRSVGRGLAQPGTVGDAMLIAYAADAGQEAKDGPANSNSPFAATLVQVIRADPTLDVRQLFGKVGEQVANLTKGAQQPARYDKLGGGHYSFSPPRPVEPAPAPPAPTSEPSATPTPAVDDRTVEHTYWQSIMASTQPWDFEEFLTRFPKGVFAQVAHQRAKAVIAATAEAGLLHSVLSRYPETPRKAHVQRRLATLEWQELAARKPIATADLKAFASRHGEHEEGRQARTEIEKRAAAAWRKVNRSDVGALTQLIEEFAGTKEAEEAAKARASQQSLREAAQRLLAREAEQKAARAGARQTSSGAMRWVTAGLVALLLVAAAYHAREPNLAWFSPSPEIAADDAAYEAATKADTSAAYRAYLDRFPKGRHVDEAQKALRLTIVVEDMVQMNRRADYAAFDDAKKADTIEAYEEYLKRWPNGLSLKVARERIAALRKRAEDEAKATAAKQAAERQRQEQLERQRQEDARKRAAEEAAARKRVDDPPSPQRRNRYSIDCVHNIVREPGLSQGFRVSVIGETIRADGPRGETVLLEPTRVVATMADGTFVTTDGGYTPDRAGSAREGTVVSGDAAAVLRWQPASGLGQLARFKPAAELAARFAGCAR
jgi:hypothetical protein